MDIKSIGVSLNKVSERYNFMANAKVPLSIPTYEGSEQTTHPKVLYFASGWNGYKYWMAHTPYPNENDDYENPSIAVSNDGYNWTTPAGLVNPISGVHPNVGTGGHYNDAHLVFVSPVLELWWGGTGAQTFRSVSIDGVNWSTKETLTSTAYFSQAVNYDNQQYELYYVDGTTNNNKIQRQLGTLNGSNKVVSPNLNVDSNEDGVADNFTYTANANLTAIPSIDDSAQKIQVTASTSNYIYAYLYQDIAVTNGAYESIDVMCRSVVATGTFGIKIRIDLLNSGKTILSTLVGDSFNSVDWVKKQYMIYVQNASAAYLRIYLEAECLNAGDTGSVWFKNLRDIPNTITWATAQEVSASLPDDFIPWHIDVIKTDLGYETLLNAYHKNLLASNTRELLWSKSTDPLNLGSFVNVLKPSKDETAFDSQEIYRSTMVKVNGLYKIWYSGHSKTNEWRIGYTEGTNMLNLKGHNPIQSNVALRYSNRVLLSDINAGLTLVPSISGRKIKILGYFIKSNGDFSSGGGTNVLIQDGNSTPVVVLTVAKSALTNGAKISSNVTIANVTEGAGFLVPATLSKPINIIGASISGGTSLDIIIDYIYV